MARRKKKPKSQTSKRIIRLLEFNPTASGAAMARALGISRQAVGGHIQRLAAKGLLPPRRSRHRSCWGCGRRISHASVTGVCRACHAAAFSYEFRCAHCEKLRVIYGVSAGYRRRNETRTRRKHAIDNHDSEALAYLQFCGRGCAMAYRMRQYWDLRREAEAAMMGGAAQHGEEVTTDAVSKAQGS